jgi:hypothetical protein
MNAHLDVFNVYVALATATAAIPPNLSRYLELYPPANRDMQMPMFRICGMPFWHRDV